MYKNNPLKDLFLTHTAPTGLLPLQSVMDLPREEANRLTAQFGKFSDRGSYYDHRKDVEAWLREKAEKAGVRIENKHPIYFSLTAAAESSAPESGQQTISLPAGDMDLSTCSFTIDDSFSNHLFAETAGQDTYNVTPHPLLGKVFSAAELANAIKTTDLSHYLHENRNSYIEVQMWARPKIPT